MQELSSLQELLSFEQLITVVPKILGILLVSIIIHRISKKFIGDIIRRAVPPQAFLSKEAEKKREDTLIQILSGTVVVILWLVAGGMIAGQLGVDVAPLLAGAGIVGVAIGFGAQYLVRDIIAGLFIVLENQYRVGDVIDIAGVSGKVEKVTLRTTVLRDIDGVVHTIPNGEIKVTSNVSKDVSRVHFHVSVDYSTDIDHVEQIINQVGRDLANDAAYKDKIVKAIEFLRIQEFGDYGINLKILGETKPLFQWEIEGEFRRRLLKQFNTEGIVISSPKLEITDKSIVK